MVSQSGRYYGPSASAPWVKSSHEKEAAAKTHGPLILQPILVAHSMTNYGKINGNSPVSSNIANILHVIIVGMPH